MKKKTYNNVLKAARLIMKKGYDKEEALKMALNIFNQIEEATFIYGDCGMTAERMIAPIMEKADYLREYA